MAGEFKRVRVETLEQIATTDMLRVGRWGHRALQNVLRELLQRETPLGTWPAPGGFFRDGFLVEGIAASFDVNVRDGMGFQYDATGITADDSSMRALVLEADEVLSTGGAPPAAGAYAVYTRWANADTYNEVRQVRPAPGAAFAGVAIDTAQEPVPDLIWQLAALPAPIGYVQIAAVVVPALPADSLAYTYTDLRVSLTNVTRWETISVPTGISDGVNWIYAPSLSTGTGQEWIWVNNNIGAGPDVLEFDVTKVVADDIPSDDTIAVGFYGVCGGAGDTMTAYLIQRRPGLADVDIGGGANVFGPGPLAGWLWINLTAPTTQLQRCVLHIEAAPVGLYTEVWAVCVQRTRLFKGA